VFNNCGKPSNRIQSTNNAQPLDAPVTVFLSVQTANEQRNYFVPGNMACATQQSLSITR
jgi:hypothetical protein